MSIGKCECDFFHCGRIAGTGSAFSFELVMLFDDAFSSKLLRDCRHCWGMKGGKPL